MAGALWFGRRLTSLPERLIGRPSLQWRLRATGVYEYIAARQSPAGRLYRIAAIPAACGRHEALRARRPFDSIKPCHSG